MKQSEERTARNGVDPPSSDAEMRQHRLEVAKILARSSLNECNGSTYPFFYFMEIKKQYLVAARDQFKQAQHSLTMAARALQMSNLECDDTLKEVKENIGDLALTVEVINDHIGE
jgi:hypothetical protein